MWRSYLSADEQKEAVSWINSKAIWPLPGVGGEYRYDYFRSECDELPTWATDLGGRMRRDRIFAAERFMVHLLRYLPGEGVAAHRDARHFGNRGVGITLGSTRVLELSRTGRRRPTRVLLFPGDLYLMEGSARWVWKHSIPAATVDHFEGRSISRSDGYAVTWRGVERDIVLTPRRLKVPYVIDWLAAALRTKRLLSRRSRI